MAVSFEAGLATSSLPAANLSVLQVGCGGSHARKCSGEDSDRTLCDRPRVECSSVRFAEVSQLVR
eukprot:1104349-Pyramimonas_sp.AAC.1